jgi:hypothetical protein
MNREMNIQVNYNEYLLDNITIPMSMNFDFPIRIELNLQKISKIAIEVESIRIKRNLVGAVSTITV